MILQSVNYKGIAQDGRAVVGVADKESPAELAELLYRRRYRALTIYRAGEVVGEITRHSETGHRAWWAET
jgi:hypothetical protein